MQGNRWTSKKEAVLISEYNLMNRKENKLKKGIDKDTKVIDRQRKITGMVPESIENIKEGYYRRYIEKKPPLSGKQVTFAPQYPSNEKGLVTKEPVPQIKKTSSIRSMASPKRDYSHDQGMVQVASSSRRKTTYENCVSHPNTNDYIRRILEGNVRDRDNCRGPVDKLNHLHAGNKSHDRRRISIDDDSTGKSINEDARYDRYSRDRRSDGNADGNSRRKSSSKRYSESLRKVDRDCPSQQIQSPQVTDEEAESPRCLDLAEYLAEENHEWQDYQSTQSQANHFVTFGKHGHHNFQSEAVEVQTYEPEERSTHVHAKQQSYANAMKLREGKIFAKFNQELKIYDLRDLDCKVGVDIHLLKKQ